MFPGIAKSSQEKKIPFLSIRNDWFKRARINSLPTSIVKNSVYSSKIQASPLQKKYNNRRNP